MLSGFGSPYPKEDLEVLASVSPFGVLRTSKEERGSPYVGLIRLCSFLVLIPGYQERPFGPPLKGESKKDRKKTNPNNPHFLR